MKKRNNYQTCSRQITYFLVLSPANSFISLGWSEDESLIIVVISNWQSVVGLISQFSHFTLPTTNSYVLKYKDTRSTHFSSSSPKSKVRVELKLAGKA